VIRLAVRCSPEQAELVLGELTVLAPNGVEEVSGKGYVEYAIYGADGELPELGELEAAAGEALVDVVATAVPDDWADRWRDFHRPIMIADRLRVRPTWEADERQASEPPRAESSRAGEDGSEALDIVVDPGMAFGTGAHPTTRLCLELLLELECAGDANGPLTDLGSGSGVLAITAAKLGWGPVCGYDHEPAAIEAATGNAAVNGVSVRFEALDLRRRLPALAPVVVANLTGPVLRELAPRMAAASTLACSGILRSELDATLGAFVPIGMVEVERRIEGDWAALLLRRP
jgi:ribosomal protein L11 methyltransferase